MDIKGHLKITETLEKRADIYFMSVHPTVYEFFDPEAEDQSMPIYEDATYVEILTSARPGAVLEALEAEGMLYDEEDKSGRPPEWPLLKLLGICKDNTYTLSFKDMSVRW